MRTRLGLRRSQHIVAYRGENRGFIAERGKGGKKRSNLCEKHLAAGHAEHRHGRSTDAAQLGEEERRPEKPNRLHDLPQVKSSQSKD